MQSFFIKNAEGMRRLVSDAVSGYQLYSPCLDSLTVVLSP